MCCVVLSNVQALGKLCLQGSIPMPPFCVQLLYNNIFKINVLSSVVPCTSTEYKNYYNRKRMQNTN